ncbi:MAG: polysaccharide biosynthesis protein [Dechloromonas sp.]|nr:polysaccharide biosynthesis protein [Dechloromonas sp.]
MSNKILKNFLISLPLKTKKMLMLLADMVLIPFSLWMAISLRFGSFESVPASFLIMVPALWLGSLPIFVRLGMYRAVVRYLGERGWFALAKASLFSALLLGALNLIPETQVVPRSTFLIYGMVLFTALIVSRLLVAFYLGGRRSQVQGEPVAVYGAGEMGRQLVSTLRLGVDFLPVVYLDRDPALKDRNIDSLNVLNPYQEDLATCLADLGVKEVLLAIPGLERSQRISILDRLEKLAFRVRTVPSMEDIIAGKARLDQLEEISVDDLLGREQVAPLPGLLGKCIMGKVVLVTGAGGSIGSELCRQVMREGASKLVLLDHSEFALYQIEMELRALCAAQQMCSTEITAILGSVTDEKLIERIFQFHQPQTVYHAAAYKHVPIVEENPFAGVHNNVIGTMVVAAAAKSHQIGHFVLISTDKAVRPTNVMGASKRMAELVVQAYALDSAQTVFSMVRFGNVLGSSGSVVPLFRNQIALGGPVTLTHQDVTRYFMTIPEAVQLVIQAGAMAEGGDVFVLDMGQPVRIYDLAKRMIRLSGRRVREAGEQNGDIEIRVTGLRPGEKLYEELLIGDAVADTEHPKIMKADEHCYAWDEFQPVIDSLERSIEDNDRVALQQILLTRVSGYRPNASDVCKSGVSNKLQGTQELIAAA